MRALGIARHVVGAVDGVALVLPPRAFAYGPLTLPHLGVLLDGLGGPVAVAGDDRVVELTGDDGRSATLPASCDPPPGVERVPGLRPYDTPYGVPLLDAVSEIAAAARSFGPASGAARSRVAAATADAVALLGDVWPEAADQVGTAARLFLERDPLLAGDPAARHPSPWRVDPRPLLGVHAFLDLCHLYRRRARRSRGRSRSTRRTRGRWASSHVSTRRRSPRPAPTASRRERTIFGRRSERHRRMTKPMRGIVFCAAAVLVTAAPAIAAPVSCKILVDDRNDEMPYDAPGDKPELDIVSGDMATSRTHMTTVVRVRGLSANPPPVPGQSYEFMFFMGEQRIRTYVDVWQNKVHGAILQAYDVGPSGNTASARTIGPVKAVVDQKRGEIRATFPLSMLREFGTIKHGKTVINIRRADSIEREGTAPMSVGDQQSPVPAAGVGHDRGESGELTYRAGDRSCVVVGR